MATTDASVVTRDAANSSAGALAQPAHPVDRIPRIRKVVTIVEEIREEAGQAPRLPLRRAAAVAVISNPFAGGFEPDLSPLITFSHGLGLLLGEQVAKALNGQAVESYGKAGIVGSNGEQEHANAALTSEFGDAFRKAIGGGDAWITSNTKVGPIGASIDVPLAYKDEIWVRSHYDTMEVRVPDAPRADEIAVIAVVASGGRINARVGGMTVAEARRRPS